MDSTASRTSGARAHRCWGPRAESRPRPRAPGACASPEPRSPVVPSGGLRGRPADAATRRWPRGPLSDTVGAQPSTALASDGSDSRICTSDPSGRSRSTLAQMSRIFTTSVASVYPHYVTKVEKKGRTQAELDEVIRWLTGFDEAALQRHLADGHDVRGLLRRRAAQPERLADHRGGVRGPRRGRRGPADAEDPLPRQARRRARQGQGDERLPVCVAGRLRSARPEPRSAPTARR